MYYWQKFSDGLYKKVVYQEVRLTFQISKWEGVFCPTWIFSKMKIIPFIHDTCYFPIQIDYHL